jgi:hypothetical protein
MSDLKFDKKDLDMVLECLADLKYEDCKRAVGNPYWEGPKGTAESVHELISGYSRKKKRYIELYIAANPNQKDYFHCPKCKRILNVHTDWRLKAEHIMGIPMFDSQNKATEFYCEDCGWTGEKSPFEEVKEGGNQAE